MKSTPQILAEDAALFGNGDELNAEVDRLEAAGVTTVITSIVRTERGDSSPAR